MTVFLLLLLSELVFAGSVKSAAAIKASPLEASTELMRNCSPRSVLGC